MNAIGGTIGRETQPSSTRRKGVQSPKDTGEVILPLTRDFNDTVQARIAGDAAYRTELLCEGVECSLSGDLDTDKAILREDINATSRNA